MNFQQQTLDYRLIHVRALTTHSMTAAGQWKEVVYSFKSKKHLKSVLVILHGTYLTLRM